MRRCQPRPNPRTLAVFFLGLLSLAAPLSADIYEWEYVDPLQPELGKQQSTTVAPGGAGVDAVPGADLSGRYIKFAYLIGADLTGANLYQTQFGVSDLTGALLVNADLTESILVGNVVTGADFSGTILTGANFRHLTSNGFTEQQLQSSFSYQNHDLSGIRLAEGNDLSGWDLSGQNLTGADFGFGLNLSGTDFTGSVIRDMSLVKATEAGFTQSQLISTASYQAGDLRGVIFDRNDLSGWDLSGQDLSGAFLRAKLTGTDLTDAIITDAYIDTAIEQGLTYEQLASTANFKAGNLHGISLSDDDLTGWDLSGLDMTSAYFQNTRFDGADLSHANLTGVSLNHTRLIGTNLRHANLTNANLRVAMPYQADMKHVNFSGTSFESIRIINADTRGATNLTEQQIADARWLRCFIRPDGSMLEGVLPLDNEAMWVWDDDGTDTLAPIPITVHTAFDLDSTNRMRFIFEDADWGSTIQFDPSVGTAYFGGTLELAMKLDEGLTPVDLLGATFQLFDWTGVTLDGWFDDVVIDPAWLAAGLGFDLSQLQTSGVVRVVSLIGDLDGDGFVGIADLNIILSHWNQAVTPGSMLSGDLSGDGFVGIEDLNTVLGTWNDSVPPPGIGSSVPEPAGAVLLGIGIAVTAGRRRIS